MKKKPILVVKNIFCTITIIWSAIMLIEYVMILFPVDLSRFWFSIFDFFVIFLYSGIFAVPILLLLSIIFMAIVSKKHGNTDGANVLNILTTVLPVITFLVMLLTNFNSRLQ